MAGTPFSCLPSRRGLKVDARTDIFSLGTVLYEMLAGRRPFEGETSSYAMVAILEKEPLPLTRYLPDASPELQRILSVANYKIGLNSGGFFEILIRCRHARHPRPFRSFDRSPSSGL